MLDIRILSTASIIVGAFFIVVLERWKPYDKGQPFLRAQFFNDLILYGIAQSYVLALVISWLLEHTPFLMQISKLGLV
ncbi:MAG TPA: sterol desaturase family protein, partial [Candidatus Kapabacteria bacterium]